MKEFTSFLIHQNLSKNTIDSYSAAVERYFKDFDEITKQNLLAFKAVLVDKYKGKTVNLRIQGINKYLEFIGKDKLKLKYIKIQQKTYLESVISDADYEFLKNKLWKDQNYEWYFVVVDVYKKMGMDLPFDPGKADLKGIFTNDSDSDVWIGKIIHKTHIEVDRQGTRAAAVTVVEVDKCMAVAPAADPVIINLDRPFVYAIVDNETGIPVFLGCMNNMQ